MTQNTEEPTPSGCSPTVLFALDIAYQALVRVEGRDDDVDDALNAVHVAILSYCPDASEYDRAVHGHRDPERFHYPATLDPHERGSSADAREGLIVPKYEYTVPENAVPHTCWDDPDWDGSLTEGCLGCAEAKQHPCSWCGYGEVFTTHNPTSHFENGDSTLADKTEDDITTEWINSPHLEA
jgi:hypothetical protein